MFETYAIIRNFDFCRFIAQYWHVSLLTSRHSSSSMLPSERQFTDVSSSWLMRLHKARQMSSKVRHWQVRSDKVSLVSQGQAMFWRSDEVRQRQTTSGKVREGLAKSGKVSKDIQGHSRSGEVRRGQARSGEVRQGLSRSDKVRRGQARSGKVRQGQTSLGEVRQGQAR